MAELAYEDDAVGLDEAEDADGDADGKHGIDPLATVRQPPAVLAQRELTL